MLKLCQTESGNVRVRSEPSLDASVIDKCIRGKTYEILSTNGEWLYLKGENGKYGYSYASYFVDIADGSADYLIGYTRDDVEQIIKYLEGLLK